MILHHRKKIALSLFVLMMTELLTPLTAHALTGGPAQPEQQGFEPVGTTDMVDLFSGDFTYNIPLMDVGGYPLNIAYHSGITMDQEASWVGLGWTLNPGSINRVMRGLPDDFKGDEIQEEFNMKDNVSLGLSAGVTPLHELFGVDAAGMAERIGQIDLKFGRGLVYNNYKGIGSITDVSVGVSLTGVGSVNAGLGYNSFSGINVNAAVTYEHTSKKERTTDVDVSGSYNSRGGLQAIGLNASRSKRIGSTASKVAKLAHKVSEVAQLVNSGATIPFSSTTYSPSSPYSLVNTSFNLSGGVGPEIMGAGLGMYFNGFLSVQQIQDQQVTSPAYGMLYHHEVEHEEVLLDFNREHEATVHKTTKFLAPAYSTPDAFSYLAQGVGGSFRAFPGYVPFVHDKQQRSYTGKSITVGVEAHTIQYAKIGVNGEVEVVKSNSGAWRDDNHLLSQLEAARASHPSPFHEPAVLKITGEKVPVEESYYDSWGNDDAIAPNLVGKGKSSRLYPGFESRGVELAAPQLYKPTRDLRNTSITSLTADQATGGSLAPVKLQQQGVFPRDLQGVPTLRYTDDLRKEHHVAEVAVTRPDGATYVYGLPAYNNTQVEKSFSVDAALDGCETGIIRYSSTENSIDNKSGIDHFYSSKTIPGYAHTYMLTAVLSPDYWDRTGDGPTDDDFGSWHRFHYTKIHSNYKWRTPLGDKMANLNPGLRMKSVDNKASFIYGEKEIWYLHTLESRTHLAEFSISSREDALGVGSEDGERNPLAKLYKLDEIQLFLKHDRLVNDTDAVPLKSVHFRYSYDLCQGVPNNASTTNPGKLTLDSLFFTYGNSKKGEELVYRFGYRQDDPQYNPGYDMKSVDRWGSYKKNDCSLPNAVHPYTPQEKATADLYAQAWTLDSIYLPSGGAIDVEYEADDYAYVQNKRAMSMRPIAGFTHSPYRLENGQYGSSLLFKQGEVENNFLLIKLDEPVQSAEDFKSRYLRDLPVSPDGHPYLYFKAYMQVLAGRPHEYVMGYAEILNSGLHPHDPNYAWIELKKMPSNNEIDGGYEVHPIAWEGWQFARTHLMDQLYGSVSSSGDPNKQNVKGMIMKMVGFMFELRNMVVGIHVGMRLDGHAQKVDLSKSWIRLSHPTGFKKGGGIRVKSLKLNDRWEDMKGDYNQVYGQRYEYKIMERQDQKDSWISSGVAVNEPAIGNDESPFRYPVYYQIERKGAAHDRLYHELPYGESQLPGPSVGYRQVTVYPITNQKDVDVGRTEHRFFTAFDFPFKLGFTRLDLRRDDNLEVLFSPLKFDYLNGTQGFLVHLNDMHGKFRSMKTFDSKGSLVNGKEEVYHTQGGRLDNHVPVIHKDGSIETALVGKEVDILFDFKEGSSTNTKGGLHANGDVINLGLPFPVPIIFPKFSKMKTRIQTAVATKLVRSYGVHKETVLYDLGSEVTVKNKLFDAQTGQVLLTETNNEYADTLYKFTYPAHWAYDNMGAKSNRAGATIATVSKGRGVGSPLFYLKDAGDFLTNGDKVLIGRLPIRSYYPYQVAIVNQIEQDSLQLHYPSGGTVSHGNYQVFIYQPVERNQQAVSVGELVVKRNPVSSTGDQLLPPNEFVTSASATTYRDYWGSYCERMYFNRCSINDTAQALADLLGIFAQDTALGEEHPVPSAHPFASLAGGEIPHGASGSIVNSDICGELTYQPESTTGGELSSTLKKVTHSFTFCFPDSDEKCDFTVELANGGEFSLASIISLSTPALFPWNAGPDVQFEAIFDGGSNPDDTAIIVIRNQCWDFVDCETICYWDTTVTILDPWAQGFYGNWRPEASYAWLANRSQHEELELKRDGKYVLFEPFWEYNGTEERWVADPEQPSPNDRWASKEYAVQYDPFGHQLETQDALGRYSAAVYGYDRQVPVAVGQNGRYRQIGAESFEDYDYSLKGCVTESHLGMLESFETSTTEYHTGSKSVFIYPTDSHYVSHPVTCTPDPTIISTRNLFRFRKCLDCISMFAPDADMQYVVSLWVKDAVPYQVYQHEGAMAIEVDGAVPQYFNFEPTGPVIEGWQRIKGVFTIPEGSQTVSIILHGGSAGAYFDDVRVHPLNATLKSYVYDPSTLRVVAELDENNYATIYEYDDAGHLVRIKKETVRGIMTLKEFYGAQQKKL